MLMTDDQEKMLQCYQQVAQLWQRDRLKLDTFTINVQCYSQTHAQNCILGTKNLVAELQGHTDNSFAR